MITTSKVPPSQLNHGQRRQKGPPFASKSLANPSKIAQAKDGARASVARSRGAEGHETIDEVVFAEKGDLSLLCVRTIEGFGVMVDNLAHRFVAVNTIAAPRVQVPPSG